MRHVAVLALIPLASLVVTPLTVSPGPGRPRHAQQPAPKVWPSRPPVGIPFRPSHSITGIEFSGVYANYGGADTWYPSWGADNVLYSPFTDGQVWGPDGDTVQVSSASGDIGAANVATGRAIIRGDDPLHLTVTPLPVVHASPVPYDGRYPSANLMYHGIWYVGTYSLDGLKHPSCSNYCVLGPFVGFHWSTDKGKTWHAPPSTVTPAHPLFGETAKDSARVKLSAAHFVDFGKDMQYSPDGKAYLVGHGATAPHSHNGWIAGDQIYLARVTPTPKTINDVRAWEFYAGKDARGRPRWSKRFADIRPVLEWRDHLGNVAITYDAPLKKFLLFTTHGWPSIGPFDTIVLEADQLTGPWHLVTYMKDFGPQGYFVNVPSKFISKDGRTMWLAYSANFWPTLFKDHPGPIDPPGGKYALTLHKIRLLGPGPQPAGGTRSPGR